VTLTALRTSAELGSDGNDDTLAVQVLRGRVTVELGGGAADLSAGQLATMAEPGPWRLRAAEDTLLLLTVATGSGHVPGG
jgi:quercetin dioxygenase-like cupin family protein